MEAEVYGAYDDGGGGAMVYGTSADGTRIEWELVIPRDPIDIECLNNDEFWADHPNTNYPPTNINLCGRAAMTDDVERFDADGYPADDDEWSEWARDLNRMGRENAERELARASEHGRRWFDADDHCVVGAN